MVHAQSIRYSNFYDSNLGAELLKEGVLLDDGSMLIIANTSESNGSCCGRSLNIVIDEEGQLEHQIVRQAVDTNIIPQALLRTEEGFIFEAGHFCDFSVPSLGYCDFYLAKLNQAGDTLFHKVYERPDTADILLDLVQTSPNKLMLIGWTYDDTTNADSDLMFLTVDTLGNELNRVVWGGAGTDYVHSGLVINEIGEVLMTGYTGSFPSLNSTGRTWVVKTDSIGNVLWHQEYIGAFGIGSSCAGISSTADGNFIAVGGNSNFGWGGGFGTDAAILKFSPTGTEIWSKEYEVLEGQGLWHCAGLSDGTIVSCGVTQGVDDSQAGWLIKTDENGDTLWTRTYNPSSLIDFIRFMLVMPNGDIVMLGDGRSPGEVNQDGWVLRVDSMGCEVEECWTVGVEELEEKVGLLSVYPNPVKDDLSIELAYPLQPPFIRPLEVMIVDMLGKEMLRFTQEKLETEIDVSVFKSGIYLLRVSNQYGHITSVKFVKE